MPISLSAARNETAWTSHRFMPRPIRDGDAPVTLNAHLRALRGYSSRRHFRRDETIFGEGGPADCVYKVISGTVRLCRYPPGGRRHIVDFVLEGDVMGLLECAGQPAAAEAVSDVTLLSYPRACVDRLARSVPYRLPQAQHRHFVTGRHNPKQRLASFLVRLADRTDLMQGERLDLPMSRQDIADHLGLAVETVHCALAALKSGGAISMPGAHELILSDMRALRVMAIEN
jgi:CRP/FNR family nitrogen fixation transcriptional regulator